MLVGNLDRIDADECAGWVLDTSDLSKHLSIEIVCNGLVKTRLTADQTRVDVGAIHGSSDHGFSIGISPLLSSGKNVIELRVDGELIFRESLPKVIDTVEKARFVEVGDCGWLFLLKDSNDFWRVLQGDRTFDQSDIRRARNDILRNDAVASLAGAQYGFFVIAEKDIVCAQFKKSRVKVDVQRPAQDLEKSFQSFDRSPFHYVSESQLSTQCYLKTDTHLSSFGNKVIFDFITGVFGLTSLSWSQEKLGEDFCGNLGSKLEPKLFEVVYNIDYSFSSLRCYDEVTRVQEANGRLSGTRIYHESNADNDLVCLLIGTSSAYNLRAHFFARFRYVYFYWGSQFDDDFVRNVRPDYIAHLLPERFVSPDVSRKSSEVPLFASLFRGQK